MSKHKTWDYNANRKKYIQTISDLFPADSQYPQPASIGKKLLMRVVEKQWKSLPEPMLKEYAELCESENIKMNHLNSHGHPPDCDCEKCDNSSGF